MIFQDLQVLFRLKKSDNYMRERISSDQQKHVFIVTQVDRLKVEGFQGQIMRDYTKLRAFELADEVEVKFIEAFGLLAQRGFISD